MSNYTTHTSLSISQFNLCALVDFDWTMKWSK